MDPETTEHKEQGKEQGKEHEEQDEERDKRITWCEGRIECANEDPTSRSASETSRERSAA